MRGLTRGDQRARLLWANPVYSCRITHFSILEKTLFPEEIGKLQVCNLLDINDIFLALATSVTTIKCFSAFPSTDALYFSLSYIRCSPLTINLQKMLGDQKIEFLSPPQLK